MITDFAVTNFRSFRGTVHIPLAPVTCLVGRNSSGKSSLLHALMILSQSQEYPALGARVPQLNLNGPLIDAGDYEDVISGHDTSLPLGFTFAITLHPRSRLHDPRAEQTSLVTLDIPRPYERPGMSFRWRYYPGYRGISAETRTYVNVELQFLPQEPFGPTLSRFAIDIRAIGKATFVRTSGSQRIQHWRSYFEGLPSKSVELNFLRASLFPFLDTRVRRGRPSSERGKVRPFIRHAHLAIAEIAEFLTESKFVGPFRTPPARRYSFTGFGAVDTGTTGQRAVDLLVTESLLRQPREHLRSATSYWLKNLGLAKAIAIKNLARRSNIFEVLVSGAGGVNTANFADVGFGISQVLPVLVQGFLVKRGGTFLIQQPELHLHPDAQAALADYFIYLASQGVTSIIETHSEYLLLRLRRRLAERSAPRQIGLPSELPKKMRALRRKDVSVLYASQDRGVGSVRRFSIDKAFQFHDMPRGFMNQAIEDRLALMKAMRDK